MILLKHNIITIKTIFTTHLSGKFYSLWIFLQLCFQRLFSTASRLEAKTSPWLSKYTVVADSLEVAFSIGDAKKNAQRISSDFYLSAFHTSESFNLENIFYDFPRLSAILSTDCIPLVVMIMFITLTKKSTLGSRYPYFLSTDRWVDLCIGSTDSGIQVYTYL